MALKKVFVCAIILGVFTYSGLTRQLFDEVVEDGPPDKNVKPVDQNADIGGSVPGFSCNSKTCIGMCHMNICRTTTPEPTTPKPCEKTCKGGHCFFELCLPNKCKLNF